MSESTYPATMEQLLRIAVEQNATDLHISTGNPPRIRVHGRLIKIEHLPPLTPADTQRLCYSVMNEHQRKIFEQNNEVDFSFGIARLSRFRANVFMQRGSVAGAFRRIPFEYYSI